MPAERKSLAAECMIFISYPSFLTVWVPKLFERAHVREKNFRRRSKSKTEYIHPVSGGFGKRFSNADILRCTNPAAGYSVIRQACIPADRTSGSDLPKARNAWNLPDFESRSPLQRRRYLPRKFFTQNNTIR